MKILIVGAGIAGLAVATHLRADHDITLIDKRTSWDANGYVMGIWSGLTDSLDPYGFKEKLRAIGYPSTSVTVPKRSGQVLRVFDFTHLTAQFGEMYLVYRPTLHATLREIAGVRVRMGTSITGLTEHANGVTVSFPDGSHETYDMLIGADGIHSQLRQLLWPQRTAQLAGLHYWTYMASKDQTDPADSVMITGNGKLVGLYPSAEDKLCAIFAVRSTPHTHYSGNAAWLQHTFGMFGSSVSRVLAEMGAEPAIFHDEIAAVNYAPWHTARTVLLGDAAHAFPPTAAMGASLAIEDAAELARVLPLHTDLQTAFATYMNRRTGRIRRIRRAANFYTSLMKADRAIMTYAKERFIRYVPQSLFLADIEYLLKNRSYAIDMRKH